MQNREIPSSLSNPITNKQGITRYIEALKSLDCCYHLHDDPKDCLLDGINPPGEGAPTVYQLYLIRMRTSEALRIDEQFAFQNYGELQTSHHQTVTQLLATPMEI